MFRAAVVALVVCSLACADDDRPIFDFAKLKEGQTGYLPAKEYNQQTRINASRHIVSATNIPEFIIQGKNEKDAKKGIARGTGFQVGEGLQVFAIPEKVKFVGRSTYGGIKFPVFEVIPEKKAK